MKIRILCRLCQLLKQLMSNNNGNKGPAKQHRHQTTKRHHTETFTSGPVFFLSLALFPSQLSLLSHLETEELGFICFLSLLTHYHSSLLHIGDLPAQPRNLSTSHAIHPCHNPPSRLLPLERDPQNPLESVCHGENVKKGGVGMEGGRGRREGGGRRRSLSLSRQTAIARTGWYAMQVARRKGEIRERSVLQCLHYIS